MDIEQADSLIAYLKRSHRVGESERLDVEVLSGGVSNRTVLVRRESGSNWVVKQALEKLRVAVDWYSSPERVHREALGMRWLGELAPAGSITPIIFEDRDFHLLGMAAVPEPHRNWKSMLLEGDVQSDHVHQFGNLLGVIHRQSFERRSELAKLFADRDFFESLRLEPYYAYTAAQVPSAAKFFERLLGDTRRRADCLVHGDYSPKNVLVYRPGATGSLRVDAPSDQLVLLDHEVIHWGDPAFDLGFAMTHLLSKAHHLPAHRHAFAESTIRFWRSYSNALGELPIGNRLESRAVEHTLGCILARVSGRSPLEYLDPSERSVQQSAVLSLIDRPPSTIEHLIAMFLQAIDGFAAQRNPH